MRLLSPIVLLIASGKASILSVSEYSGLVSHFQVPVGEEDVRSVWFSIHFDEPGSWIHSPKECPVFMNCEEEKLENYLLPGGSRLGSIAWSEKPKSVFPQFQDVVGQLGLGPDGQVSRGRIILLGLRDDDSLGIKFESRDFEVSGFSFQVLKWNPLSTTTREWRFQARPVILPYRWLISQGEDPIILINVQADDHALPWKFFNLFKDMRVERKRLYLKCSSYNEVFERFEHYIDLNGAKLYVRMSTRVMRKLRYPGSLGFGIREFCPTNIVETENHSGLLTLGRSLLQDFDVALDSDGESITLMERNNRFTSVGILTVPRLATYRLDFSSVSSDPEGIQFDWIPATGIASIHDFIFVRDPFVQDISRIEVYLVSKSGPSVPVVFPPVIRNEWSGSMKIEMLNDGRIRVWERREFAITDVSFSNERFGFFDVSLKGWRFQVSRADSGFIEFIPVGGPSRECEIILREKHPALETDSEGFQRIPMVNGRALSILPDSWIGVPLLQVIDDGRIQITSTSADVEYAIHSGSQGITFGPSFARIWLAVERGKLTMYRHHQPDLPMVGLGPLRGLDGSAPRGWIDFVLLGSDEVNLSDFGEVVGTPIMVADSGFDVISTSADPLSQFAVIVQRRSRNLVRLHFIDTRLTRWRVEKGNSLKLISGLDFLPVTGDPVTGEILLPSTPALETKADGSLTLVLEGVIPHSIDPQKCLFEGSGGRWNGVPHLAIDTQGVLRIAAGTTDTPYLLIQDCSQGAGKVVLEWKPVPELFRQVEAEPSLAGPDSGCPICLEDFETNEMVARTKCRHDYHLSCLSNLRESGMAKCALCRANLRGL